ncbi:MAG: putative FMN/FAD exporter YeeO [Dehalococcoidia bacterium]|nr:putative FMN/FAD exporter YeeO [Chloroflexota bacterium]
MRKGRDLTEGHIVRNITYLSWPIVVSALLQTTVGIVDTMMVGVLGPQPLAAVGMGHFILMLVLVFLIAISTGAQVFVARYFGAKDPEGVTRVVDQSLILSVILATGMMALGLTLSPALFRIMGAEEKVLALGVPYVRIIFGGILFMLLNFIINSILQGAGDSRTPLKILLLINILNVVLNYLLIFGIGFFPRMEVRGAAWGTVISRIVGAVMGMWVLMSGRFAVRTDILRRFRIEPALMSQIVRIGFPAGLQGLVRSGSGIILLRFVANTIHGTYAVAALTVGLQAEAISFMPGFALGTSATILVGQNLGAGKPDRAERNGLAATWIAAIVMSCMGLLFFIFAEQIMSLFTESADVVHIGGDYLRIMAYSQPFLAMVMVFSGGLRGAGDTRTPLIYSIIHSWLVRIPLIYVLGFVLNLQTTGIWWAMTLSTVTQGLATWWKFQQGHWQRIKL